MKICPTCNLRYPTDAAQCFVDRTVLVLAPDPYIGTVIAGKYRIEGIIGVGGMATVYRARQTLQDRFVAVKVFRRELSSEPKLRERFRREATSARRLAHRNVIEILDEGESEDGTPFLVMEYLEGETLEAILKAAHGPIPLVRAIELNLQTASGLARAHDFQVIHRDLKPDNLYVCHGEDGTDIVKILDFGIARCMHDPRLTGTGEVFGTPQYMAPERINSIDAGPAADLYALGCILFRCVVGRLPFVAHDVTGYLIQHLREPPPSPRSLAADVPPDLDALILQCLDKDPARRPVDAHALVRGLTTLAIRYGGVVRKPSGVAIAAVESPPSTPPVSAVATRPGSQNRDSLLSHASVDRWQRRVGLLDTMLQRVSPAVLTPHHANLLGRVKSTVARMSGVHQQWLADQQRMDDVAVRTRDGQKRFGRAMDSLAQDLSTAREAALQAMDIAQQHEHHAGALTEAFTDAHARLGGAVAEPSEALVQQYRAAYDALDRALTAREDMQRAKTYAATRETEVRDLEFQISALREQLEKVSQAGEGESAEIQQRVEQTGGELARMETDLIRDASELVGSLRAQQELKELFAALEADAA